MFLDELSYGPGSTPGTEIQRAEWEKRSKTARSWALKENRKE